MALPTPVVPSLAPPPQPQRPRTLVIGTALATAGILMLFVALIAIYVSLRQDAVAEGAAWLPEGATIPLTPPNMAFTTLLMSVVTMQWGVYAIRNRDRANGYLALGLTIVLGLAYINSAAFLYSQMGLGIADSVAGLLIYAISGAHLVMTGVGLVFAALVTFRALGGEFSARDSEGLTAAAFYWYATVAVYAVIWYVVYITK
jgi:heme/copper-type cytochrome/quinol oxidase subunit 3